MSPRAFLETKLMLLFEARLLGTALYFVILGPFEIFDEFEFLLMPLEVVLFSLFEFFRFLISI
jgi:hypothetical protein